MTRSVVAVIAALVFVMPIRAQTRDRLPAEVETVISGGWWESGAQEGRYRVVIRSGGFEHVISTMTVDWIVSPTETSDAKVVASVTIPTTGVVVHDPVLLMQGRSWMLRASTTDSHYDPPRRARLRVVLGAPGVARVQR